MTINLDEDITSELQLLRGIDYDRRMNAKLISDYTKIDTEMALRTERMIKMCIVKVIFNDPATIVYWGDGSRTVVKVSSGDKFDPEKGLAMAIAKYHFGNKGNYYKIFKSFIRNKEKEENNNDSVIETKTEEVKEDTTKRYRKLTSKDVKYIRKVYIKGDRKFGGAALGKKFGVNRTTIYDIIHNETWKDE